MITHSKNLYRSIVIDGGDQVSSRSHGIYNIIDNKTYTDLRLAQEKPFWGHSHPLMEQALTFQNLIGPEGLAYEITDRSNLPKKYILFSKLTELEHEDQSDLCILIDENILGLNQTQIAKAFGLINSLSKNKNISIIESDLQLFCINNYHFTPRAVVENISNLFLTTNLHSEVLNIKKSDCSKPKDSIFFSHYIKNFNYILSKDGLGKFFINSNWAHQFIKSTNSKLQFESNYVYVPNRIFKPNDLTEHRILISELNTVKETTYFAIPSACTKKELLDTLTQLNTLIGK